MITNAINTLGTVDVVAITQPFFAPSTKISVTIGFFILTLLIGSLPLVESLG
ncbi:Uncharacterised protein [Vibrio cholerae]|nr:Uncharacterised protein [Vibrio cholerae]